MTSHYIGMKMTVKSNPGGVLAGEFATCVRPTTQAPSAANHKKSTHHRCKIYVKPTHNGQKLGHFEGE